MRKALFETRPRRSESDRVRQRAYAWIAVTTKLALSNLRNVAPVVHRRPGIVGEVAQRHVRIEYCVP